MFNIKVHPALKPVPKEDPSKDGSQQNSQQQQTTEEHKQQELNTLTFYKHRLDRNSMRVLFLALQSAPYIHTLKFSNNGFTHQQFSQFIDYLNQDSCPIQHLFLDWNPIHENDFSTQHPWNNKPYERKTTDETSLFAKLLQHNHKLQVLFLRASNVTDEDVRQMCHLLKPDPANPNFSNKTLKVLDISYNPVSKKCLKHFADMMETNRTLEYLGLAKCNLQSKSLVKVFNQIGRIPFPADQVDGHLAKIKARDQTIEKNKKLKASKKPEEPIPILDSIEQATVYQVDGSEVPGWVMLKNMQFKHINLCLNEVNDDVKDALLGLLRRTNDDFGVTLSGNPVSKDTIDNLHRVVYELHTQRVGATQVQDPNNPPQIDPSIHLKRIAF